MNDPIFEAFLRRQHSQGMELASQSDLVQLLPVMEGSEPPRRYVARFFCTTLVRQGDGVVTEASESAVGIYFPSDYLRRIGPLQVLTMLDPAGIFHPNIRWPAVCTGRIVPGMELVDLLYQMFEILTYHNWASHDAMDPVAASWARNNQDRLPVDRRPLKRRNLGLGISQASTP